MSTAVVDTNVPIVANGRDTHASELCQLACIGKLTDLRKNGVVVLDELGLMFDEYRIYLNFSGQPGTGDAFFRHLYQMQYDPAKVERVTVTLIDPVAQTFAEFPPDPKLAKFDKRDRKFVAAAKASVNSPPIINAVDSGWLQFETVLKANGVTVEQLCPDHLKARSIVAISK